MLIAERNGIRRLFNRSNRSNISTDFREIVSTLQKGTLIPAFRDRRRARASHSTTFVSSVLWGNFAINRSPFLLRTEAFGRAPPSEDPGARSKRMSSSVSASPSKCSAATSSRGNFRSEEHTSELQSRVDLVCRLLLEKKKTTKNNKTIK